MTARARRITVAIYVAMQFFVIGGYVAYSRLHSHHKKPELFGPYNEWKMPPCS
jgi:hypothetical protein